MGYDPTPEQQAAIDAFCGRGENLAVEARAGTGKTSTMRFLGMGVPRVNGLPAQGVYMAYNRSIADEAARDFPPNVLCKTGHGHTMLGMQQWQWQRNGRGPRQTSRDVAMLLGINGPERVSKDVVLSPQQIASATTETIEKFARSGGLELTSRHVPVRKRIDTLADRDAFATIVLPWARKAWADLMNPTGRMKWNPDVARKMFHLEQRRLPGHFLFLDEAQDSNGVTIAIVKHQQDNGMRVVAVGDQCQAINGWMGAIDAMGQFGGTPLQLSKSFRFGPAIAGEANKWLTLMDATPRITGHDPVASTVGPLGATVPDAILTRTNAKSVEEAMRLTADGVKVSLVKTVGQQIERLAKAAKELKARNYTSHEELCAFTSWGQVQEYVENDHTGSDLKVFVDLVDRHTPEVIITAMQALTDTQDAQVTISTAHRSKGMEWDRVRIASDFERPLPDKNGDQPDPTREDLMLAYVAVTRAKKHLDPGGLSWVNDLTGAPTAAVDPWVPNMTDPTDFVIVKHAVESMNRSLGFDRHGVHLRDAG